jgi:hypothetical protein
MTLGLALAYVLLFLIAVGSIAIFVGNVIAAASHIEDRQREERREWH